MSHGVLNSLTHVKHVVAPYWKTTGKVIIAVKTQLQSKLCTEGILRYTAMGHIRHRGQNCYKGGSEMLYLLLLSSCLGRGNSDLLKREVPSVLYGKNTHLHAGCLGRNRTKHRGHHLDWNLRKSTQLGVCVSACDSYRTPKKQDLFWTEIMLHTDWFSSPIFFPVTGFHLTPSHLF